LTVCDCGAAEVGSAVYQVAAERERVIAMAFPASGDRARLRAMLDASVDGDRMGV
jgi:hypothetical protein